MPHTFTDIPELADLEAGRNLVRIPMEQDVPFTPRVRSVVDSPEFQRLAHISQLGLTSRIYPGATHTRFEHALGVFHNSLRYLRQLAKDTRFCELVTPHEAEVLMVAALLHDVGHWPFCHPIEDMGLADLPPHETFAAQFLGRDRVLAGVLKKEWQVDVDEVLDVLVARTDTPTLRLLRSVLSGPIDIDKMDYLERDSLHCGVPYGRNFDKNRLIHSLVVNEAGDGLAISSKGKTAAELMVFARYVMFSEVYWHHAVRSATSMFARAFYRLHADLDLHALFQMSESDFSERLRAAAAGSEAEPLVEGIFGPQRRLFKRVGEYSFYQSREIYEQLRGRDYGFLVACGNELANILSVQCGTRIRPEDVLIDAPPRHREVEFKVQIHFPKEDIYRPLHVVSPVVDALARTQFDDFVKRVRVFVHPDCAIVAQKLTDFDACLEQTISAMTND